MRRSQFLMYTAMAIALALPGAAVAEDPDAGGEITGRSTPPVAAEAQVSTTCNALFARLRAAPSVSVWWTTNYFANGFRFMGITAIELRVRGGDLVGQGRRFRFSMAADGTIDRRLVFVSPSVASAPETVTLRIRADGQIMFNDMYGPYKPICWSERFAGVHSKDSIETFNFKLP